MKIVYSFFFQLKYSDNSLVFFLWRTQPLPGRSQFPEEEDFISSVFFFAKYPGGDSCPCHLPADITQHSTPPSRSGVRPSGFPPHSCGPCACTYGAQVTAVFGAGAQTSSRSSKLKRGRILTSSSRSRDIFRADCVKPRRNSIRSFACHRRRLFALPSRTAIRRHPRLSHAHLPYNITG